MFYFQKIWFFFNQEKLKETRSKEKEVRNSWVTNSSYETELRKITSDFELLTRKFLQKFFFPVTNSTSWNIKLNFELFLCFRVTNSKFKNKKFHLELLTQRLNFHFFAFELLTRRLKIKKVTNSIVKHFLFHFRVTNSKL